MLDNPRPHFVHDRQSERALAEKLEPISGQEARSVIAIKYLFIQERHRKGLALAETWQSI